MNIEIGTIAKSVIIFNLLVSDNFLDKLFSCNVQRILSTNMFVVHMLGLMSMYFFILLTDNDIYSRNDNLLYPIQQAFEMYLFFILLTRTNAQFTFPIIFMLFTILILDNMIKHLEKSKDQSRKNQSNIKTGKKLIKALFYIAVSLTVYAFFLYLGEKRMEYKINSVLYNFY